MFVTRYSSLSRPLCFPPEILHAILADVVAQFLQDLFISSFIDWESGQKCLASNPIPALLQVCHQYREVTFTVLHDALAIKGDLDGCLPIDAWMETEYVMRALSLSRCGTSAQYDEHIATAQRCSSKLLQVYLDVGTMEGSVRAVARSHVTSFAPIKQAGNIVEHVVVQMFSFLNIAHETFYMSVAPLWMAATTRSLTLLYLTFSRFTIINQLQKLERLGEQINNDILQDATGAIANSLEPFLCQTAFPWNNLTILETVSDLNTGEEVIRIACLRTIPALWNLLDNQQLSVEPTYLDVAEELLERLRLMMLSECAPLTCSGESVRNQISPRVCRQKGREIKAYHSE